MMTEKNNVLEEEAFWDLMHFIISVAIGIGTGRILYWCYFGFPLLFDLFRPYIDPFAASIILLFGLPFIGFAIGATLSMYKVESIKSGIMLGIIEGAFFGLPLIFFKTAILWLLFGIGSGAIIGAAVTGILKILNLIRIQSL